MSLPTVIPTPTTFAPIFKGFYEDSYLLSYRDLFASEADALKGKQLDPRLVEMDQKEYEVIKLESEELNYNAHKSPVRRICGLFALAFLAVVAGIDVNLNRRISIWTDRIPFDFMVVTWISALIIAAIGNIALSYDHRRLENRMDEISHGRRNRLNDKVNYLEQQLKANNDPVVAEQLTFAKNKLSSNLDRALAKIKDETKKN